MNPPRLTAVRQMCRATGIRIKTIKTAAISSITMNRVSWTPRIVGRSIFHSYVGGVHQGSSRVVWSTTWPRGSCAAMVES